MLHIKETIKLTSPHSYIRPSINTYPNFSERKANQDSHGIFPSTKITKLRATKGNDKAPWRGSH